MKLLQSIKDWFINLVSEEVRKLKNELGMKDKTIHSHFVRIQDLELALRNKEAELQLARKNDNRDPKTGRFVKAK